MRKVDEFYSKYSHLADYYGNKIWKEGNIGMEKEDIKQEMRLRLFLAIKSYARKWGEYKKTGKMKPIPIEYYLKTTMINKSRDFIREINQADFVGLENHERKIKTYMDSVEVTRTEVTVGTQKLSDLFTDNTLQKKIMKMYFLYNFDLKPVLKAGEKFVKFVTTKDEEGNRQIVEKPTKRQKKQYIENVLDDGLEVIRQYLKE